MSWHTGCAKGQRKGNNLEEVPGLAPRPESEAQGCRKGAGQQGDGSFALSVGMGSRKASIGEGVPEQGMQKMPGPSGRQAEQLPGHPWAPQILLDHVEGI